MLTLLGYSEKKHKHKVSGSLWVLNYSLNPSSLGKVFHSLVLNFLDRNYNYQLLRLPSSCSYIFVKEGRHLWLFEYTM